MNSYGLMGLLLLLLFLACTARKNTAINKTKLQTSGKLSTQSTAEQQAWLQQHWLWKDSSANWYKLSLKPKGQFSFDLQKGFSGYADDLQLETQQRQQHSLMAGKQQLQQLQLNNRTQYQLKQQQSLKKSTTLKKGFNVAWLYLLLMIPLIISYIYLRKRYRLVKS